MSSPFFFQIVRFLYATALAAVLASCGGGTSGTGIDETRFVGTIYSVDGVGIAGVQVSAREGGDRDTSDDMGKFTLEIPSDLERITLEFQTPHSQTVQVLVVELNQTSSASDMESTAPLTYSFVLNGENNIQRKEDTIYE